MRTISVWLAVWLTALVSTLPIAASSKEDLEDRLRSATEVLQQIMQAPDKGIPEEVLNSAKCVVVIPHLVKGGFVFGAKYGKGVASCRTSNGDWSAPAFVTIGGGSFGLQIGVEGVDLVMLVMNEKGLQHLLSSKFEITGEGSAAAGPVGRHASAGTNWKLNTELLTYSRSKGAFAGATVEGAVIEKDDDSTVAVYGKNASFRSILSGAVPSPAIAQGFRDAIIKASRQSKEHEAAEKGD